MSEISEKKDLVNLEDYEALKRELEEMKKKKQNEDNEEIEKKPAKSEKSEKVKRERTEKQKESFQKALEARKKKIDDRNKLREQLQEQAKKEAEEELIKKAIKYKKQQIKKIQVEIPDSDSSEEEVIEKKPMPAKPKLIRSTNESQPIKQNFPASKEKETVKFKFV